MYYAKILQKNYQGDSVFGKNKKPDPKKCGVQRIAFSNESTPKNVSQRVPDKESPAYSKTLTRNQGQFDSFDYSRIFNGTWRDEIRRVEITSVVGEFTCRRTENDGLTKVRLSRELTGANAPVVVAESIYETVRGLGWCATCPYFGMSSAEADVYDANLKNAKAAELQADLALRRAQDDLEQYLKERGGDQV